MSSAAAILYQAAKESLVEYFQNTSLNGCGLLYYIRRRKYQRIVWFMFIAMGVLSAIYICFALMLSFLSEPTVTSMDAQPHTIWDTPFPSVAVCSNNKLSRNAMYNLARNLSTSFPNTHTPSEWLKKLELFAGFYNTDSIDFDEALNLQNQLDAVYGGNFNTSDILRQLSPKCQDIIMKCFWTGKQIDCNKELKLVAFARGYCCVFNYNYERLKSKSFYYPNGTGVQMGLSLLLNASTKDFFYTDGSFNGFAVQLFEDQEIPDISTGQVREFHADAGDDVGIILKLTSQRSATEVLGYSVAKRNCYFPNEYKDADIGASSCFLNCKIKSIINLCDCVPYYAWERESNVTQCTLTQSECLDRYRITWQTYDPSVDNINEHLKAELLNSINCPQCFPLCSYNIYQFTKAAHSLKSTFKSQANKKFFESIPVYSPDLCLVKIYFLSKYQIRYQKNVLYNWYQILSNIGGVTGICMGCSIITGYEIFHFGVVRLIEKFLILKTNRR